MTKRQRRWLGLGIAALVIAWIVYDFSRSTGWREFRWERLWFLLRHADPYWLLAAVFVTCVTYLVRAYRWKFFLAPIKRASVWTLFRAQVLGFSSIYLIGRPGEIVRPAYIAKREHVSFTSQVAIWLLERIYDTVGVAVLFALALYLQPRGVHAALTLRRMHEGSVLLFFFTGALVAALALYRVYSEPLISLASRALRFLPAHIRSAAGRLARSFADGLDVIEDWRDLLATIACTALLWVLNVTTFWMAFRSLGGAVGQLSWWAAGFALFFAALGLVLQIPGIGGGYEVGIILALRQIFHVPAEGATSAGLMAWLVVLVPCVALGVILLLDEGLSFKKLGILARQQQAATAERARRAQRFGGSPDESRPNDPQAVASGSGKRGA